MNILVLCTGNSARSVLLEYILNDLGEGRVRAYSAGSQPAGRVHPQTEALLGALGHDLRDAASKSWDVFAAPDAPEMQAVITVCGAAAGEVCPIWPGAPVRAHWGVEDPAAVAPADQPHAFRAAHDILRRRAVAFLDAPVERLDAEALGAHLRQVGRLT